MVHVTLVTDKLKKQWFSNFIPNVQWFRTIHVGGVVLMMVTRQLYMGSGTIGLPYSPAVLMWWLKIIEATSPSTNWLP